MKENRAVVQVIACCCLCKHSSIKGDTVLCLKHKKIVDLLDYCVCFELIDKLKVR